MKILLLTCLVASAFAAPAEKTKRDILPGDSRYGTEHHHHDKAHDHHDNDVEIAKALGDSTGSFPLPTSGYGVPGLEAGTPFGSDELKSFEQQLDSSINKVADEKFSTRLGSSAIESTTKSSNIDILSRKDILEGEKVSTLFPGGIEDVTKVTIGAFPSDFSTTTGNPVNIGGTSTFDSVSVDSASAIDSSTSSFQPDFGSSFGSVFGGGLGSPLDQSIFSPSVETSPLGASGFPTFEQGTYNPGFLSTYNFNENADKKLVNSAADGKVAVKSDDSKDSGKTTFESTTVKADFGSTVAPDLASRFSPSFNQPIDSSFFSSSHDSTPFNTAGFGTFDQAKFSPSSFSNFGFYSGLGKELPKSVNNFKVEVTTSSSIPKTADGKTLIESTTAKPQTFGKEFPSIVGSAIGSRTTPIKTEERFNFGSEYNSGFPSSFGQSFGSDLSSSSFGSYPLQPATFENFDQLKYIPSSFPSYNFATNAGKEPTKSVELGNVLKSKTAVSTKSSDPVKTDKLAKLSSSGSFGTAHPSISQTSGSTSVEVIPSISSGFESSSINYPYTPSFDDISRNYGGYYGGLDGYQGVNTFGVNTYSGLNNYAPSQYQNDYSLARFGSSSYPSSISGAGSSPFGFDVSNQGSYLSPSIGQQQLFGVSTPAPSYQENVFKSYQSPTSFVQPTSAPFYNVNQPEVKIGGSSFSGISQQTDANGGYVY